MDREGFLEYLRVEKEAEQIKSKYSGSSKGGPNAPLTQTQQKAELMGMFQQEVSRKLQAEKSSVENLHQGPDYQKKTHDTPQKSGVGPSYAANKLPKPTSSLQQSTTSSKSRTEAASIAMKAVGIVD
jgi:hypothetical protein